MNYIVNQASLPPELRTLRMQVWVGNSPVSPQVLEERGLQEVFALTQSDAGEYIIQFAVASLKTISPPLIRRCQQCARGWLSNWAHI